MAQYRVGLCGFDAVARPSAAARLFVDAIERQAGGTSLPVMRMPAPST